jgi:hypothetical protein
VGLDALLVVVENGTDREVPFQRFEGFLHRDELNVVLLEFGRIVVGQIGPQQLTPFAASDLSQLLAIERKGQFAGFFVDVRDARRRGPWSARLRASSTFPRARPPSGRTCSIAPTAASTAAAASHALC